MFQYTDTKFGLKSQLTQIATTFCQQQWGNMERPPLPASAKQSNSNHITSSEFPTLETDDNMEFLEEMDLQSDEAMAKLLDMGMLSRSLQP